MLEVVCALVVTVVPLGLAWGLSAGLAQPRRRRAPRAKMPP
jgi:hypothetical protein